MMKNTKSIRISQS